MAKSEQSGLVVLVGAGPGSAALITTAGANWLSKADVIVYDRLADQTLLRLAREEAERIYLGKAPAEGGLTQEQINALLIDRCCTGQLVVRLKGGDPFLFGRGGEEAEALAKADCEFRIVPGVTAAAAAAYAGIPLTDRRWASTVALVTGREDPTKDESTIAWDALAKIDTLVFYMGVGSLPAIADHLLAAGRSGRTPAAIIENAATPRQRTIVATLGTLAVEAKAADIRPPALIIVGKVVALRQQLAWLEKLPLFGQTMLVTHSPPQVSRLSEMLTELGAEVIEAAAIQIEPPEDFRRLDAALSRLNTYDWLVLTSPNGAERLLARMESLGLDARTFAGVKIAAVGPATAEVLRRKLLTPDLLPEQFTTQALGEALSSAEDLRGKQILLARADIATPKLADMLRQAEAAVEEVTAYRITRPTALPEVAVEALAGERVGWITFASSSGVENFLALIGPHKIDLSNVKLAAIGPVTAETLQKAGLTPAVVADPHTIDALVKAIAIFER